MLADPDVLTVLNVAEMLECPTTLVEALALNHVLPGLKLGGAYGVWVFPKSALLHVLNTLALQNMTVDASEQPASAALAALRPVGVELPPRTAQRPRPVLVSVPAAPVEPERA
jgi:hypothetical protein